MKKILLGFSATFYFLLVFYLVFFARRRWDIPAGIQRANANLLPFYAKIHFLTHPVSDPKEIGTMFQDIFGNILMFVPFSLVLYFVFNITNKTSILLRAFLFTVCIEITQYIVAVGVADIDDILLNTLGAVIGVGLIGIAESLLRKLDQHTGLVNLK